MNEAPAPLSTYRLQFSPSFRFADAEQIVPYLARLGVGAIYASPYLRARPGSGHGYDVVDPNALNPEIGTPEEHAALLTAARAYGLGHVLDFVPNHMGVGGIENPWWQDVLEWGERSPYAEYFDIDWRPLRRELHGKVLLPFLGDHYGQVLERGELVPHFDAASGTFAIAYFERSFALAPTTYGTLLTQAVECHGGSAWALRALAGEFERADRTHGTRLKRELAEIAREPSNAAAIAAALAQLRVGAGEPGAADRLDALLQRQFYRLAFWRVSIDEINYRRFFDVNDLAGVRVEDPAVFEQTHRLIFDWIGGGTLDGLRIDHVDGLYDPGAYCRRLVARARELGHPQYVVVEKILARFERLRDDWEIAGTTGYDFMNVVNGLFVDPRAEHAIDRTYRRFAGISTDFEQFAYRAKRDIMRSALASELEVLARMLDRIAEMDRRSNDYTFNVLRDALVEVIASFPVYRTYLTESEIDDEDRRFIEWAVAAARKRSELGDDRVFDFIESVLLVRAPEVSPNYERRAVLRFALKFAQYTSPVMAKAVEDTAFYRYVRLLSLNEVGGDPRRFGSSVAAFHRTSAERAEHFPQAMLASATHDHKRGEDARTRIDAISEMPTLWDRNLRRWSRLNARKKTYFDGNAAPTENDEYALYQTLLGTLPLAEEPASAGDLGGRAAYVERICAYTVKAAREAKFRSSWTNPNLAYEEATTNFVRAILDPERAASFLRELRAFARECALLGALSSLSQTTLKLTAPGVPDLYAGSELWDLSLVDPDNRRPVDYQARAEILDDFEAQLAREGCAATARALLSEWPDGRVKAYVVWRLLHLRRARAELRGNAYTPLATSGPEADRLLAFAREGLLVVVPRLVRPLLSTDDAGTPRLAFGDERIVLPPGLADRRFVDRFTEAAFEPERGSDGRATLAAAAVLGTFPVAVLVPE